MYRLLGGGTQLSTNTMNIVYLKMGSSLGEMRVLTYLMLLEHLVKRGIKRGQTNFVARDRQ